VGIREGEGEKGGEGTVQRGGKRKKGRDGRGKGRVGRRGVRAGRGEVEVKEMGWEISPHGHF